MSRRYPEIEDRAHAECISACFEACKHLTLGEVRAGVVSKMRIHATMKKYMAETMDPNTKWALETAMLDLLEGWTES